MLIDTLRRRGRRTDTRRNIADWRIASDAELKTGGPTLLVVTTTLMELMLVVEECTTLAEELTTLVVGWTTLTAGLAVQAGDPTTLA
jgi:hypothetical protein